jgi:hypothetical protein
MPEGESVTNVHFLTNFLIAALIILGALFLDSYIGLTQIFAGPAAATS